MNNFTFFRFGHGRLINSNEVRKRLDEGQKILGLDHPVPFSFESAVLLDYEQSFVKESFTRPHFGAGNVSVYPGSIVEGVIIRTTAAGAEILDRAEGVHEGHYVLKQARVRLQDNTTLDVPIYVAHPSKVLPDTHPAHGKPHPEYLLAILTGGKEQGFSQVYIKRLASVVQDPEYITYVKGIATQYKDQQVLDYLNRLLMYSNEVI